MTFHVPQAIDSEKAVLAELLITGKNLGVVASLLSMDDWYVEAHAIIFKAIVEAASESIFEPGRVRDLIAAHNPRVLDTLVALFGITPWGSLEYHCKRISDSACLRALNQTGRRLIQRTESGEGLFDGDPVALAEATIDQLRVIQHMGEASSSTLIDLVDIIARPTDTRYVIPGLLAQGNRIVITAPEGYGKSSLLRQIATCAAVGVHPFSPRARIRPINALVVDCENPAEINTREYQRVVECLERMDCAPSPGQLYIDEKGPTNLLDGRIAAQLYNQVERLQPELIVIGPIYQLHEENPNDEGPARKLSAVLDRLRAISGAALVTEAHTPHNDGAAGQLLRPYGASLWKRWPEFGYCLHPTVTDREAQEASDKIANADRDRVTTVMAEMEPILTRKRERDSHFTPWRGARAVRDWPKGLKTGAELPWVVTA